MHGLRLRAARGSMRAWVRFITSLTLATTTPCARPRRVGSSGRKSGSTPTLRRSHDLPGHPETSPRQGAISARCSDGGAGDAQLRIDMPRALHAPDGSKKLAVVGKPQGVPLGDPIDATDLMLATLRRAALLGAL